MTLPRFGFTVLKVVTAPVEWCLRSTPLPLGTLSTLLKLKPWAPLPLLVVPPLEPQIQHQQQLTMVL